MLKPELIATVAKVSGHSEKIVRGVHEATASVVLEALAKGETVMLLGLGKIKIARRAATRARNMSTGEAMNIPARNVASLKPSDAVREAVNP